MAIGQLPFGEGGQVFGGIIGEDGVAGIEKIDPAIEFAGTRFGASMGPFGHDPDNAALIAQEGENLRSFAEFDLAEADAMIGDQCHKGIIASDRPRADG